MMSCIALIEQLQSDIAFIRDTKNPALESLPQSEQDFNHVMMIRECAQLLEHARQLISRLHLQGKRLDNRLALVCSLFSLPK